ncbi:MAG: GNAT family N-acetyltransferase [Caldilineaceae bacterium]|nr:GNAT family N-acetyltransferase [Caldilineaceae bacterium]
MSNPARAGSAGVIQTERLDLLPLGVPFLEAFLEGDAAGAARRLGHPLPPEWQPQAWVSRRLAQLHADPTLEPWLLRAVILRTTGRMIGRAGFHTAPGPDYLQPIAPGGVEMGYEIFPAFRRQGYATEVVAALMAWAAQEHGVRRFVLSIRPDNLPSQRIAQHFDFHKIGSHIDEEDGLEEIFLLDLDCEV